MSSKPSFPTNPFLAPWLGAAEIARQLTELNRQALQFWTGALAPTAAAPSRAMEVVAASSKAMETVAPLVASVVAPPVVTAAEPHPAPEPEPEPTSSEVAAEPAPKPARSRAKSAQTLRATSQQRKAAPKKRRPRMTHH